jgi:hypothetical protein
VSASGSCGGTPSSGRSSPSRGWCSSTARTPRRRSRR